MRDGWFYVANGNSGKIMVFSSYGDLIFLLYNPQTNPTPALQALDPAVSDTETSSGTVSTRGSVAYPFSDIGEIAVASDKTLYVEDAVADAKVVKDTRPGRPAHPRRSALRQEGPSRRGTSGRRGSGERRSPTSWSLHVTARDQLVVVTPAARSRGRSSGSPARGRCSTRSRSTRRTSPSAAVKGVTAVPGEHPPRPAGSRSCTCDLLPTAIHRRTRPEHGSPQGDDVISRVYKLNLRTRQYDSFVELPQNPARKETRA